MIYLSYRVGYRQLINSIILIIKAITAFPFAYLLCLLPISLQAAELPADEYFRKSTVAEGFEDPMEISVAPSGNVYLVERKGALKVIQPKTGKILKLAQLDVEVRNKDYARECGLMGITLDPQFAKNKWLYLYYTPKGTKAHQLSRFTVTGQSIKDEKKLISVPYDPENNTCHEGGSIAFGPDGMLYLSTGDNTCPFKSNGSAPIDEGKDRKCYDAQRSAGNTNDLRGKILRIKPTADGRYTIPDGNLFPQGTEKTRPEIYIMGCRNPYRISVDPKTNFLYWGKVGPDAGKETSRGPRGYDEINQAREAGNYGWPYFSGANTPYADYDFVTKKVGGKFSPKAPVNHSVNNTGLTKLPPAQEPLWFGARACICAGPVYYSDLYPSNDGQLPAAFDSSLIVYDWAKNTMRILKMDKKGKLISDKPWLAKFSFKRPGDMELGPNGELYVLEYGSEWYDGSNGKLTRIRYSETPQEIIVPTSDPRMKGLPKKHPGSTLIGSSTCLACHMPNKKSIGPSYLQVAHKYANDENAAEHLIKKILEGGNGVWGEQPMPAHSQHTHEEASQMVDAIMQVKPDKPKEKK